MRRLPILLTVLLAPLAGPLACGPKPTQEATVAPEPDKSVEQSPADESADAPADEEVDAEAAAQAEREQQRQRAINSPPPAGLAAGLISDFESGQAGSEFGAGWQKATDEMAGGASTVEYEVVSDGPDGSPNALHIRGTIDEGSLPNAWAGAMFFPGDRFMEPANLITKPILTFHARGDGPMMVMIFAEQKGTTPAKTTVEIGEDWGRYEVDLRTLVEEPYDVTAIFFGVPPRAGTWEQWLDDVRLKK